MMKELFNIYRKDIESDGFRLSDTIRYGLPMTVGLLAVMLLSECMG